MADNSAVIGLSTTLAIVVAVVAAVLIWYFAFKDKPHTPIPVNNNNNTNPNQNPATAAAFGGQFNNNGVASGSNNIGNGNGSGCNSCKSSPPSSPRADAIALGGTSITIPSAFDLQQQPAQVSFAETAQIITIPNPPPMSDSTPAAQMQQAFAGDVPASILKRQSQDSFSLSSLLPATVAVSASGVTSDAVGDMMSAFAPNPAKLFQATTQVGNCRTPVMNGRSPKARLIGSSGLLRPPAPMPCKTGGGEISWGDSDMRHYALENNMPPVSA